RVRLLRHGVLAISMFLCSIASEFRVPRGERTRKQALVSLLVGALCLAGWGRTSPSSTTTTP
ncbi:hypothetical protein EVA_12917, partial [gut metagenome]